MNLEPFYFLNFLILGNIYLNVICVRRSSFIFRGSRSEERDFQEEEVDKDSDRLDDDYNWEYNSGDYDRYQYGGHNGYNQYGDEDVGNETNDYHDGDLQWQHGVEERGESFWRSECRDWNAEEVTENDKNHKSSIFNL